MEIPNVILCLMAYHYCPELFFVLLMYYEVPEAAMLVKAAALTALVGMWVAVMATCIIGAGVYLNTTARTFASTIE